MRKSVITAAAFFFFCSTHLFAVGTMVKVLGTINGSTLKVELRGKETQLRLLGIATPDPHDDKRPILKRLGLEAQDFLKEFTKSGFVYVEFPSGEPVVDKNGVVLASAWGGKDSELINEKLVMEGFGVVDRKQPTLTAALREQLIKAEDAARMSRRGIWGSFSLGKGQDVASGKAKQGTYLGAVADPQWGSYNGTYSSYSGSNYVVLWIIYYR
jgi:endonuclease YncB( thermonuclease family)